MILVLMRKYIISLGHIFPLHENIISVMKNRSIWNQHYNTSLTFFKRSHPIKIFDFFYLTVFCKPLFIRLWFQFLPTPVF